MTAQRGQGFPKAARIRRRREFLSFGRTGQKRRTDHFVLLFQRKVGEARLGITVSRKAGGAVARNLLKRRIREVFRRHPAREYLDHDLVVIAKPGIGSVSTQAIDRELSTVLQIRDCPSPVARQT